MPAIATNSSLALMPSMPLNPLAVCRVSFPMVWPMLFRIVKMVELLLVAISMCGNFHIGSVTVEARQAISGVMSVATGIFSVCYNYKAILLTPVGWVNVSIFFLTMMASAICIPAPLKARICASILSIPNFMLVTSQRMVNALSITLQLISISSI